MEDGDAETAKDADRARRSFGRRHRRRHRWRRRRQFKRGGRRKCPLDHCQGEKCVDGVGLITQKFIDLRLGSTTLYIYNSAVVTERNELTPLTKLGELEKFAHQVCTHINSKRIELEGTDWSGLVRF